MATFGDFQSIFQLAAGLTLGFSGFVSLFGNPLEHEARKFAELRRSVQRSIARHSQSTRSEKRELENLEAQLDSQQEEISVLDHKDGNFPALRATAFIASALGLYLLVRSSELADRNIDAFSRWTAYALILYVPCSIAYLALILWRRVEKFTCERRRMDSVYVECVMKLRGIL